VKRKQNRQGLREQNWKIINRQLQATMEGWRCREQGGQGLPAGAVI
jgi:hypothetical protein